MIDYHHMAYPLERRAQELLDEGNKACIDLFLGSFKGFYLASISQNSMNIEYIKTFLPSYFKAINKFGEEPIKGLEELININGYDEMEIGFYELIKDKGLQELDEIFIEIKAVNGFLDYCMGLDYERFGIQMCYKDCSITNNKESTPLFLNAINCYQKALILSQGGISEEVQHVIGHKRQFEGFKKVGERLKECIERYFKIINEPVRELTAKDFEGEIITFRELWKK